MIYYTCTKLMSYERIVIPKDMRKEMQFKTSKKDVLYFENDRISLLNPVLG